MCTLVLLVCCGESAGSGPQDGGQSGGNEGTGNSTPAGRVKAFVAQGHVGRTVVSCDDGRTWIHDRSLDQNFRCFQGTEETDCDHHPGASLGMTYGEGYFVATFGWGKPGGIRRSRDGVNWEEVLTNTIFGGIAYGNALFFAGSTEPQKAGPEGTGWQKATKPSFEAGVSNVRRVAFLPHEQGFFVLTTEDGEKREMHISRDNTATWSKPTTLPEGCGAQMNIQGGFAYGNGVALVGGSTSVICASKDGGATWTSTRLVPAPQELQGSKIVWNGSSFVTWTEGLRWTSANGTDWTSTPTQPVGIALGALGYAPDTGTYVAVNSGWTQWYDKQHFYRSSDGVSWEELSPTAAPGGHPLRFIEYGEIDASAECPAP